MQWTVNVDVFINLPYPQWYLDYCLLNLRPNYEAYNEWRAEAFAEDGERRSRHREPTRSSYNIM